MRLFSGYDILFGKSVKEFVENHMFETGPEGRVDLND